MIPPECMEYTKVFQILKLEVGLAMIFGVLVGLLLAYLRDR